MLCVYRFRLIKQYNIKKLHPGMRGKKNLFLDELRLLEYLQASSAAAASSADVNEEAAFALAEKRVPASGFMGMRGKRNPAQVRSSPQNEYADSAAEEEGAERGESFDC